MKYSYVSLNIMNLKYHQFHLLSVKYLELVRNVLEILLCMAAKKFETIFVLL